MTTLAPATLRALMDYWVAQGGVNLGIVGDTAHVAGGTSYHLGKDDLRSGAYSVQTARDRAGLSQYASAVDLGKLKGGFPPLRKFSLWYVDQCRHNAADTRDVREVIYSPDGLTVLRWDRERGVGSAARDGEADYSHRTHSHVSFYRDSRLRDQRGPFKRYFEAHGAPHYHATVKKPTPLYNPTTKKWMWNGRNAIPIGTQLLVRGARYVKAGVTCYPIVDGTPYGGYFVPVDNVVLGARA